MGDVEVEATNSIKLTGAFAERLKTLRGATGESQSELAKEIWGTTTDNRGYEVARNRDRISAYEKGRSNPSKEFLAMLAGALGVTPEVLAPELVSREVFAEAEPAIELRVVEGGMFLKVASRCTQATAFKVIELLQSDPVANVKVE